MATIENKSTLFHWNKIQSGPTTEFEEVAPILTQGSILAGNPANDGMPVAVTSTDIGKILKIISDDNGGVKVSWESQDAGHSQNTDVGTSNSTFYLGGETGVKLSNHSGILWVRTPDNLAYSGVCAKTLDVSGEGGYVLLPTVDPFGDAPSADYHAVHKKWVLDQLGATAGGLIFKGTADSAAAMSIPYQVGDLYRSGFAGTFLTHVVEVGDWIAAVKTRTEGTPEASDWAVWQSNIDGAVTAFSGFTNGGMIIGAGANKTLKSLNMAQYSLPVANTANTITSLTLPVETFVGRTAAVNGPIKALDKTAANTILGFTGLARDFPDTPLSSNNQAINKITRDAQGLITEVGITTITAAHVSARRDWVSAPTTNWATATGEAGDEAYDSNYHYVWIATDTVRRTPLGK
jgi:hypothetical protein